MTDILARSEETAVTELDPRRANDDLKPLAKQSWGAYNIFAFWMSGSFA